MIHTDYHDIAEDKLTISFFGGAWRAGLHCGVSNRQLAFIPSTSLGNAASQLVIEATH